MNDSDPNLSPRVSVAKTLKLFVNGAFVRSESGATTQICGFEIPNGSRKDVRDAIRAGATAFSGWSSRDAYNRGQVLYRVAEMLESRISEFVALQVTLGVPADRALLDVTAAVDVWVHYAGWSDKLGQVFGTVNAVSGSFVSYTAPEPLGLVAVVLDADVTPSLIALSESIASTLAAGNTSLVFASGLLAPLMLTFAEVLATSDVPAGVVQLVASCRPEAALTAAGASQVVGLDLSYCHIGPAAGLAVQAADTFTRVLRRPASSVSRLSWQLERKTVWHPSSL